MKAKRFQQLQLLWMVVGTLLWKLPQLIAPHILCLRISYIISSIYTIPVTSFNKMSKARCFQNYLCKYEHKQGIKIKRFRQL